MNLYYAFDGEFEGVLSGRRFKTAEAAEKHDSALLAIAESAAGRKLTEDELRSGRVTGHKDVSFSDRGFDDMDVRYADQSYHPDPKPVVQDKPMSRADELRETIASAKEQLQLKTLSSRELLILKQEQQLAEEIASENRKQEQSNLRASKEFSDRLDKWEKLSVLARFNNSNPAYEIALTNKSRASLENLDFDYFDRVTGNIQKRIEKRAADAYEAAQTQAALAWQRSVAAMNAAPQEQYPGVEKAAQEIQSL